MRKSNTEKLSKVLKSFIAENKLERKMTELDLVKSWEQVMGKTIARYTRNVYLKDEVLFVVTTSSIVRNELSMMEEQIRERLNELAGEEIVKSIVFR